FSDWTAGGPAGAEPERGQPARRAPEAKLVIEPGLPTSLQLYWIAPPDRSADSVAYRRKRLTDNLGFAVLNRRLSRLARGAQPPFISAAAYRGNQYQSAL